MVAHLTRFDTTSIRYMYAGLLEFKVLKRFCSFLMARVDFLRVESSGVGSPISGSSLTSKGSLGASIN